MSNDSRPPLPDSPDETGDGHAGWQVEAVPPAEEPAAHAGTPESTTTVLSAAPAGGEPVARRRRRLFSWRRVRSAAIIVLAVAGIAALSTTAQARLTEAPEACCADGLATTASGAPAATPSELGEREGTEKYAACVIGSWKLSSEKLTIKFFSDVGELDFEANKGQTTTYKANGKGQIRYSGYESESSYQGIGIRYTISGTMDFTWYTTNKRIYVTAKKINIVITDYVGGRQVGKETVTKVDKDDDGYITFTCAGKKLTEKYRDGNATFARTNAYGVY